MNNGAIKKIDELGRIVIPKDIRKRLSIKKDDSLEVYISDNYIKIVKAVAVKNYNDYTKSLVKVIVDNLNIKVLATNREEILFNNTDIVDFNVKKMVSLSLYDLLKYKEIYGSLVDIRPIIIDSNVEGIVLVDGSVNNELVGQIINILITNKLDISC